MGFIAKEASHSAPVPGCCVDRQSHAERGQQQPSKQLKLGVDSKKCRQMFRSDQHDFTATLYNAAGKTHKKEAQKRSTNLLTVKQPIPNHPTLPRHPLSDESNNKWHTTEYDTQTNTPMCDTGGITPRIQRKHAPPTPWEAQTRNRRAHHTPPTALGPPKHNESHTLPGSAKDTHTPM